MAENDKYGVWDTKNQSWVRNKQFDSVSKANGAANRMDTDYGGSRYTPKLIPGQPVKTSETEGNEQTFAAKKGGKVSASTRADGIAQRGKTRGKMC